MTARRRPKQTPQPEVVPVMQFTPGEVLQRVPASTLEMRVAGLEQLIDLLLLRLAVTESSLECALTRISLLQNHVNKDLLGI